MEDLSTNDIEARETPTESSRLLGDHEQPQQLRGLPQSTRKEQAMAGLAAVSFAASIASLIFSSNIIVLVSGTAGAILSPYAAVQQRKIKDIDALEETTERMKKGVTQLQTENKKLQASVKQLESSISNLKAIKQRFNILQSVQGQSIDELEKQLDESRKILAMQKDSLSADILSNIMTVVIAADDNGDLLLSDKEIDEVTKNIQSLHGVDFNEAQLKKLIISKGRDIPGLMDMVKTLLESETVETALEKFRQEYLKAEQRPTY
ncbi:hypothetical protein IV203_032535 [Nitzschia inconspicua]|uniref:Uncharacterized protein n=1 Tax=Nitzschia inconspicua TaxID=303405 RepID=A0A9K3KJP4_9STRA|nr:hypothetical protein IV203_032535 [Nitzschia inconspicua]